MAKTPDGEPVAEPQVATAGPLILKQPVFHWQTNAAGAPELIELAPGDAAPASLSPEQIEDFRARGIL